MAYYDVVIEQFMSERQPEVTGVFNPVMCRE